VEYRDAERSQSVVSVPANFADLFWSMEKPPGERVQFIKDNIDKVLSADGRSGRIRQLIDSGYPVILLTHWQSLYTQGTGLGLEGLSALAERIQEVFGNNIEWVSITEMARRSAVAAKT
jgi:hypothetical protein